MMKMDDRDSAECQNWENKDIEVIMEIDLNEENDKIVNSCPLPLSKGKKKTWRGRKKGRDAGGFGFHFLERECLPYL